VLQGLAPAVPVTDRRFLRALRRLLVLRSGRHLRRGGSAATLRLVSSGPTARRVLPIVPVVPLGLLALAAMARPGAPIVLVVLAMGFLVIQRRGSADVAAAWAAGIPVAVSLSWSLLALPPEATDGSTCASVMAPFATWRLAEAALALGTLAILVRLVGGGFGGIGFRRPSRRVGIVAMLAFAAAGPLGLLLGPPLAEPFFGPVGLRLDDPLALVPAVVFAVSNGMMEEAVYRGSLQTWTARSVGLPVALVGQAVVFGLAHAAAPDVGGIPALLFAAMTGGGLLAGLIVWRTGSLAIAVAAHVGFDLPLYYGNACRV
jgi:membrane protease YdiL (CAAX protease family)